jgi:hypothetical protein
MRMGGDGCELAMARWGMPSPAIYGRGRIRLSGRRREVAGDLRAGAARWAAAMAADSQNCGAIAFSRLGDLVLGNFEDAVIIRKFDEIDEAVL